MGGRLGECRRHRRPPPLRAARTGGDPDRPQAQPGFGPGSGGPARPPALLALRRRRRRPGETAAATFLSEGILLACDGSRINFCPDEVASPDLAFAVARHLAGREPPRIEGRYQPQTEKSAPGCERLDACVVFGVPETEIARLAMWVSTDALVASLRPSPPGEGVPEILLLSAERAESLIRTIGAREAFNPPLDGGRLLTRAETLIRLVSWARGIDPEPCPPPAQPTL